MVGHGRGVVLIFGVVAHALDLMVPEAIRKKLEPMMPSCLCACVCGQKIFKNASSRVARAFKDVKLNEKQPTESYWNVYILDTSQGGSFHCYFSYFLLSVSWLHPFRNRMWYLRSANQLRARENTGIHGIDLAHLATCS